MITGWLRSSSMTTGWIFSIEKITPRIHCASMNEDPSSSITTGWLRSSSLMTDVAWTYIIGCMIIVYDDWRSLNVHHWRYDHRLWWLTYTNWTTTGGWKGLPRIHCASSTRYRVYSIGDGQFWCISLLGAVGVFDCFGGSESHQNSPARDDDGCAHRLLAVRSVRAMAYSHRRTSMTMAKASRESPFFD